MSADFDWATLIAGFLTAAATGGGVLYAARQIKLSAESQRQAASDQQHNERWRRTEFARNFLDRLNTDDELAFAARAFDWGVGPMIIPQKYRPLFPAGELTFPHNPPLMARAVAKDLEVNWSDPKALTYRYAIDAFFSYLDNMRIYLESGALSLDQLEGVQYYVDLVRKPRYLPKGSEATLKSFVSEYYPRLAEMIWPSGKAVAGQTISAAQ